MKTIVNERQQSKITAAITAAAVTAYIPSDASSKLPTAPFVAVFGLQSSAPEIVLVTAVTTTTVPHNMTIARGMLGTTAAAWAVDEPFYVFGAIHHMVARIADVSTAETLYLLMPKCILVKAMSCISATISVADDTITLSKNAQAITGGVITIAYSGSAAGDVDSCSPTAYTEFNGTTDYLKIANGGESTTTSVGMLTLFIVPLD